MLTYFIYFIVFLILMFVLFIAVQAITRGIEAKENNKLNLIEEKSLKKDNLNFNEKYSPNIATQITELSKLYEAGSISEDEFKRAKEKILK